MANNMQLGVKAETTYGTPVVVDRWLEFLPGESLERQQSVIMPGGLRPGLYNQLGPRRALVKQWGEGSVPMEVATTGFGIFFEHALGTVSVATNVTGSVYTHTYTPGSLAGKSLTVQKGVEPWTAAGTALPFTFHGGKVMGWEFSIGVDGFALFSVDMDFEDCDTSTALAAASYGTVKNFNFKQGTLSIGATSASLSTLAGVSAANISGANSFANERYFLGSNGLKNEPLENGFRTLDGSLTMEFRNQTDIYTAFESDTEKHLRLVFEGDAISGTWTELLQIDLYDVRFEGETPKITGPEPAPMTADFTAWEQDNGNSVAITYRTSDATA